MAVEVIVPYRRLTDEGAGQLRIAGKVTVTSECGGSELCLSFGPAGNCIYVLRDDVEKLLNAMPLAGPA